MSRFISKKYELLNKVIFPIISTLSILFLLIYSFGSNSWFCLKSIIYVLLKWLAIISFIAFEKELEIINKFSFSGSL